jgi:acyl-CoA synthetase (AMP-forming)/AMP-acid ligase II
MENNLDLNILNNILNAKTIDGNPAKKSLVPFHNIRHALALQAQTAGERPYLIAIDADGNRSELSYQAFNAQVHQTACFLRDEIGVGRGDRVATIAYNHHETVIVYFACWLLGAAVAPQNVAEDDPRIAYILRNSEAVVCFVRNEYLERAERIINGDEADGLGAPNIRQIVTMGGDATGRYVHFNDRVSNHPDTFNDQGVSLEDEALLVYTSGTTGAPKGVVLTQYNLLVDALAISTHQAITGGQRLMCVLPIHHVNGIVMTLVTPLYVGASTVLNRSFSAKRFWAIVAEERVHIVSVVPTLLQFLLEQARAYREEGVGIFGETITRNDLSGFRHFVCGAGTLALSLVSEFEGTFGIPILHGYGLSETTCYSCFLPIDLDWETHQSWLLDHGYPSIGVPIHVNEMAIFSADGLGKRLGAGERGEICIRGHNVMKHYFKRDDANAETFKFGWFRSGDEGFYLEDEQGRQFFFITGRIKELINRGGVKFSPFDIEEVLLRIEGVKVGLAVAFKNAYYGEEVGAYVVLEQNATLTADDILARCREQLTFEKSPKVVIFGEEIPVTSTGKYQRLRLADLFAEWEHTQFRKSI